MGIVIPEPLEPTREIPVDATCLRCDYKMLWKVVLGNRGFEREARAQGRGLGERTT